MKKCRALTRLFFNLISAQPFAAPALISAVACTPMVTSSSVLPEPLVRNSATALIRNLSVGSELMQWRRPSFIRKEQLRRLQHLLRYAQQYSPYYSDLLKAQDFTQLSWQQFSGLPVLSRETIRQQGTSLDCEPVPSAHGRVSETMTSGSTGSPVKVRTTQRVAAVWFANALRDHLWHGRDAAATMAAIRWRSDKLGMAPEGIESPDWGEPHALFYQTGKGYFLNSSSSIHQQLQWLRKHRPDYLISHPSNLQSLLQALLSLGDGLPFLKEVRTVCESVSPDLRKLSQSVLGVGLVDFYSSQELGYVALQCPQSEHYHVLSDSVVLEVVDETGEPCPPGKPGRVLLTSLHNYATPLIRYDIDDRAVLGEACSCGRGLPVLKQVLGRSRNMVSMPGGGSKWPNLGFRAMMEVADIQQFQVVQHTLDRLELKLVLSEPLHAEQERQLEEILRRYLEFPFRVDITYHAQIPRSASGKYEDFLNLIEK